MDASTAPAIHWLAVIIASLTGFILGGLWYGPLFGKAWQNASGVSGEKARSNNRPSTFILVEILNLIAAISLALFIGSQSDWKFGLFAGFMTGTTFIGVALGINYLFEQRPLRLWLINCGYMTLNFSAMGAILGAWH
jgi:hypothetical protein